MGSRAATSTDNGPSHLGFVRFLPFVLRTMEASAKSFDKPLSALASTITTRINCKGSSVSCTSQTPHMYIQPTCTSSYPTSPKRTETKPQIINLCMFNNSCLTLGPRFKSYSIIYPTFSKRITTFLKFFVWSLEDASSDNG